MKKLFVYMLVCVLCLSALAISGYAAEKEYKVIVKAGTVEFKNEKPVELNGTIYVPVRPVFEKLGCKVSWDNVKKAVLIEPEKDLVISIPAKKNIISFMNEGKLEQIKYSPASCYIKDRIYVPKELFSAMGMEVTLKGKVLSLICTKCNEAEGK